MSQADLLDALAVTIELTGSEISKNAAKVLVNDLRGFPEEQVIQALQRIRFDGVRVNLSNIILRLQDGRPAAEEAWAMLPHDEQSSQAITAEMAEAMDVARLLLREGDAIAARMAFKEKYTRLISAARMNHTPVHWFLSLGSDKNSHEAAVIDAVMQQRISLNHALMLLPPARQESALRAIGVSDHPLLESHAESAAQLQQLQHRLTAQVTA